VARLASPLPEALVGLPPAVHRVLDHRAQEAPLVVVEAVAALVPAPAHLQALAELVVLDLAHGVVADTDGMRGPVTGGVELLLADATLAAHPVEDLQLVGMARGGPQHEVGERVGDVRQAHAPEAPCREGRVAHPAEAVVPVARCSRALGQRGGRRGGDRIAPVGSKTRARSVSADRSTARSSTAHSVARARHHRSVSSGARSSAAGSGAGAPRSTSTGAAGASERRTRSPARRWARAPRSCSPSRRSEASHQATIASSPPCTVATPSSRSRTQGRTEP
jgi:hypothetical protein